MLRQKFIDYLKNQGYTDEQIKDANALALDYLPRQYHDQQISVEVTIRDVLEGKIKRENIPSCSLCEENCRDPRFPVGD